MEFLLQIGNDVPDEQVFGMRVGEGDAVFFFVWTTRDYRIWNRNGGWVVSICGQSNGCLIAQFGFFQVLDGLKCYGKKLVERKEQKY